MKGSFLGVLRGILGVLDYSSNGAGRVGLYGVFGYGIILREAHTGLLLRMFFIRLLE